MPKITTTHLNTMDGLGYVGAVEFWNSKPKHLGGFYMGQIPDGHGRTTLYRMNAMGKIKEMDGVDWCDFKTLIKEFANIYNEATENNLRVEDSCTSP
jgi:hypothetical protein